MSAKELVDFFHEKKQKSGGDIDWDAKKAEWLTAIDALYGQIREDYLAALVKDGTVSISEESKTIVEDYIGKYDVPVLVLQIGEERAIFSPKGRNIVGATGRVDLIGERGEKTLVVQPDRRWGLVATRTPTLKILPLDEASLLEALKDVMR